MTPTKMVSAIILPLVLIIAGCSTSEFGGNSGVVGKKDSKKDSESKQNGIDAIAETDTASGGTINHDGAQNFEQRSDIGATEHDADTEVAEGCRLPKNVKSTIAATPDRAGAKGLFELLGWGGGGTTATKMEITGLDIRDCSWFEKVKGDPNVKFAYVFQKKLPGQRSVQSFAEPAVNAKDLRVCTTKAADVTKAVGNTETGVLQCALIPRDKDGQVIEN